MNVSELIDLLEEEQSSVSHSLQRLVADELIHMRKEGSFRFYSIRSNPVLSFLNEIERFSDTGNVKGGELEREDQARRAREAKMREYEHQLHTILEHAPVSLSLIRVDGEYLAIAGEMLRLFRVSDQDVIGKNIHQMYPADSIVRQSMTQAFAGEEVHWTLDTMGYLFEVYSMPIRNAAGEVQSVLSITLNVTDWARTKNPGGRLEDVWYLMEYANEPRVMVNRANTILMGHRGGGQGKREDLTGKNLFAAFPDFATPKFQEALQRVRHSGTHAQVEVQMHLGRSKKAMQVRLAPMWQHGAVYAIAIAVSSIPI